MMLRADEAIPKGAEVYVDAGGALRMSDSWARPEWSEFYTNDLRGALETLINPFSLGDPVDLADMEHRGAKRRAEIRLRGDQRRAWIEAEGRRRREEIGHIEVECVPMSVAGAADVARELRYKEMFEKHMVDVNVFTSRGLRVPKELLR